MTSWTTGPMLRWTCCLGCCIDRSSTATMEFPSGELLLPSQVMAVKRKGQQLDFFCSGVPVTPSWMCKHHATVFHGNRRQKNFGRYPLTGSSTEATDRQHLFDPPKNNEMNISDEKWRDRVSRRKWISSVAGSWRSRCGRLMKIRPDRPIHSIWADTKSRLKGRVVGGSDKYRIEAALHQVWMGCCVCGSSGPNGNSPVHRPSPSPPTWRPSFACCWQADLKRAKQSTLYIGAFFYFFLPEIKLLRDQTQRASHQLSSTSRSISPDRSSTRRRWQMMPISRLLFFFRLGASLSFI